MIELLHGLYEDEANVFALTLSSANIAHRVVKHKDGAFGLWVESGDVDRAVNVIREYMDENRDNEGVPVAGDHYSGKSLAGLWGAAGLMILYILIAVGHYEEQLIRTYASSASRILAGEVWRTVTALGLHSNALHLAGNMVGIALFGSAVCGIAGWGIGALMILFSGALGNFANALFYETRHVSIGASTAVFGALGILAGYQFLTKIKHPRQRVKAWLPLAGGLALLAILGSGTESDIMAHLFGFFSGILLGLGYTLVGRRPKRAGQWAALACFVVVIVGACVVPLLR